MTPAPLLTPDTLAFTASIAAIEYHLTASVLANVGPGVAIMHAEGFEAWMTGQDDLRLILVACETCRDCDTTMTLCIAKRALMTYDHWGLSGWDDESLVEFAMEYFRRPPVTRECAQMLATVHRNWTTECEEHGPMYCPPAVLGKLDPLRIGFALAKLSRLSGLPLDWIHERFAKICFLRDAKITVDPPPKPATYPLVINAPRKPSAKGAA